MSAERGGPGHPEQPKKSPDNKPKPMRGPVEAMGFEKKPEVPKYDRIDTSLPRPSGMLEGIIEAYRELFSKKTLKKLPGNIIETTDNTVKKVLENPSRRKFLGDSAKLIGGMGVFGALINWELDKHAEFKDARAAQAYAEHLALYEQWKKNAVIARLANMKRREMMSEEERNAMDRAAGRLDQSVSVDNTSARAYMKDKVLGDITPDFMEGSLAVEAYYVATKAAEVPKIAKVLLLPKGEGEEIKDVTKEISSLYNRYLQEVGGEAVQSHVGSTDSKSDQFKAGVEKRYGRFKEEKEIIMKTVERCSKKYNVPEKIIYNVMAIEMPRPDQPLANPDGAVGFMQLENIAVQELKNKNLLPDYLKNISRGDLLSTAKNIEVGVIYLRYLFDIFAQWGLALSAYNGGAGLMLGKIERVKKAMSDKGVAGIALVRGENLANNAINAVTMRRYGELNENPNVSNDPNEQLKLEYPFRAEALGGVLIDAFELQLPPVQ